MVSFTGFVFLALSLSKVRERVAKDVPEVLRIGIQAGVGTLICFIGLRGASFIVANPSTFVAMGSLASPPVLLTLLGLLGTLVLVALRIPGALIISIAALTIAGFFVPTAGGKMVTTAPSSIFALLRWPAGTFLKLDFVWLFSHFIVALPLMFYFVCAEFFSTWAR
jgi:AGZA family xanthine/uracil permease-like MFS transporter